MWLIFINKTQLLFSQCHSELVLPFTIVRPMLTKGGNEVEKEGRSTVDINPTLECWKIKVKIVLFIFCACNHIRVFLNYYFLSYESEGVVDGLLWGKNERWKIKFIINFIYEYNRLYRLCLCFSSSVLSFLLYLSDVKSLVGVTGCMTRNTTYDVRVLC